MTVMKAEGLFKATPRNIVRNIPWLMSAFGTKRTCRDRTQMSAFGGSYFHDLKNVCCWHKADLKACPF
jgi:hypothetical protein